ncbi:MAG: DNA-directed RNA polymerase subunit delta [Bacilli bacterium]|nr:DNA-directed RNA polymerase subunit delta [Bacilli bacterium]
MKLKDIPQEELELMGYDDIAVLILEESGKKMKIFDLFKKVCNALNLSEAEFENKIADFFEILSTDKKFTMLENGYWDLRAKHNVAIVIDEDEEETLSENIEDADDEEIEVEESEEDIFYEADDTDDEPDDDLQDLVVIDVDEEEPNSL